MSWAGEEGRVNPDLAGALRAVLPGANPVVHGPVVPITLRACCYRQTGLHFHVRRPNLGATGELHEPVPLHRGLSGDLT